MTEAAASRVPAAPEASTGAGRLDDLMLAMDVVDTLRHQDTLVARELDGERREADLVERLRRLYKSQGIAVPDRVLLEGVRSLEEARFAYAPPPPGLSRTLAELWVGRHRLYRALLGLLALAVVGAGLYYAGVVRPRQERIEAARIAGEQERRELSELLPRALETGHREVLDEARVDEARARADQILGDGRSALARRDREGAQRAVSDLEELRAQLRREYTLRIVSRPGEPTGVWRIPARNRNARNYYVVVEAVSPDNRLVELPVTSEEDGRTAVVSRWGQRVSEATFESVRRDKDDDGIVQRNQLGEKRRGQLDVDYAIPVENGAILRW
ncbi:DUF6384 family protein [Salinarimonas soli]|uniref:Uncharacterized protein n=1 Tax=Salinarimonas soli TaxID=1638099 RepID=A0A5B2VGE9_9HYPH|nr:DUF6384 family protein [Salinarimonas soli]KAA2237985.1 hypothetical protein F0L46_06855 [Salinarimonas soli]